MVKSEFGARAQFRSYTTLQSLYINSRENYKSAEIGRLLCDQLEVVLHSKWRDNFDFFTERSAASGNAGITAASPQKKDLEKVSRKVENFGYYIVYCYGFMRILFCLKNTHAKRHDHKNVLIGVQRSAHIETRRIVTDEQTLFDLMLSTRSSDILKMQ